MDVLTPRQRLVAEEVIAQESLKRAHIVVSLSGAHAYGFSSLDSDLDLKAVHYQPTSALLGLAPPSSHTSRMEVIKDVEIDYSSNELQQVLASFLSGNGNYFERFLGPIQLAKSPDFDDLRQLARKTLSRRIHRHYVGFARSQLHEFEKSGSRSAKKLLYVFRTALTGIHALLRGDIVTNVRELSHEYRFPQTIELIEIKKQGECSELSSDCVERSLPSIARVFDELNNAWASSPLPEEPTNRDELNAWLVEFRRKML